MIGTIQRVRPMHRFCWIINKDSQKFFGHFNEFKNRNLQHVCMIKENSEVHFSVVENTSERNLAPNAVDISIIDSVEPTFQSEGVEATITVWNSEHGFASTDACGCNNLFVHIGNFITDPAYLTSEFLHVGSKIICNVEEESGRHSARAVQIELLQPEGFDASVLQNV